MSLNDFRTEHVCQQIQSAENSLASNESLNHGSLDCNSTPYRRRRQTNQALEALGQLVKDSSSEELDDKLNKNDILGLTIARLLRHQYIPFNLVNPNIHLLSYVDNFKSREDFNGFFLVLNASGRILFISDSAEHHLRKNVRSLYSQLTNIFQCINQENHDTMRKILAMRSSNDQQMICTWNLPRGKRPSRTNTESKVILITGHYFHLHTDKDQYQQEPLFLAKCEQILSSTPNIPTNSLGSSSNMVGKFVLNDNLHVHEVTSNIQAMLNYQPEDLINTSLSCLLTSESWNEILQARENCIQVQHCTTMSVVDMYTVNGDRLTFICNFYALPEGKRKPMKFGFIIQLIDPSIRDQCNVYTRKQNEERLKSTLVTESLISSSTFVNDDSSTSETNSTSIYNHYLTQHGSAKVSPATVIPQRRKRRNPQSILPKPVCSKRSKIQTAMNSDHDHQHTPMIFNTNSSSPSSDNSILSFSPIQEISFPDDFFSQIDDILLDEVSELTSDFSVTNEIDDIFGINTSYHQTLFLTTPTLPSCSFFA